MNSAAKVPRSSKKALWLVRFISPVPVRSRVRMRATLKAVEDTERSVQAHRPDVRA
jgi:acyl dehydratase